MIDRPPPQLDKLREQMSQLQPPAGVRERVLRAVEQGLPEQTSRRPALILVMRWAALLLPALATAAVASIAARHFGWFGRGPSKPAVIEHRDTPKEKAPAPPRRHRHQAATPRTVPDAGPAMAPDAGVAPVAATAESQTEQRQPVITLPRTNGKRRSSAAPHRRLAAAPAVSQPPPSAAAETPRSPSTAPRSPSMAPSTRQPAASPSAPPPVPPAPSPTSVQPAPSKREPAPIPPSALAEQVVAYRRALALSKTNPRRAAAEWQKQLARWPESPLVHEVELQLIDSLVRAGKTRQARAAARRFLERHPDSPRSAAVRAILDPGRPAR